LSESVRMFRCSQRGPPGIIVTSLNSGPIHKTIGKSESRQRRSEVFKAVGQFSGMPNGVADQSNS
jgi:hypothetical protein